MTDLHANAAANLADALARAGNADPAVRAAKHAAAQAHVPRICAWLNDMHHRALFHGDRAAQIDALARDARAQRKAAA